MPIVSGLCPKRKLSVVDLGQPHATVENAEDGSTHATMNDLPQGALQHCANRTDGFPTQDRKFMADKSSEAVDSSASENLGGY